MGNQLVMYEEELQQINRICEGLQKDSNGKAVLVIDKNGQAIADAGEVEQLDVTSLSSLTAGNVAATGGIAQLLSEKEFAGQFHEGERTNIHISIVAQRLILVVLFDERSSLGLVRLRVRKAAAELDRRDRASWSRRASRPRSRRCSRRSPTPTSTTCSTTEVGVRELHQLLVARDQLQDRLLRARVCAGRRRTCSTSTTRPTPRRRAR